MRDFWVNGHYIAANSESAAREDFLMLYGAFDTSITIRPWTAADQEILDNA